MCKGEDESMKKSSIFLFHLYRLSNGAHLIIAFMDFYTTVHIEWNQYRYIYKTNHAYSSIFGNAGLVGLTGWLTGSGFFFLSGGSRISRGRGRGPRRGDVDSRDGYVLNILYVKTKESRPLGGVRRARPL